MDAARPLQLTSRKLQRNPSLQVGWPTKEDSFPPVPHTNFQDSHGKAVPQKPACILRKDMQHMTCLASSHRVNLRRSISSRARTRRALGRSWPVPRCFHYQTEAALFVWLYSGCIFHRPPGASGLGVSGNHLQRMPTWNPSFHDSRYIGVLFGK